MAALLKPGMSTAPPLPRPRCCAALIPADPAARAAVEGMIERLAPAEILRYAPKDDDALNDALCEGRCDCALFADIDALMRSVFRGHAEPRRWIAAGARIELADPPPGDPADWRDVLDQVCAAHERWKAAQRRMRVVAGSILSALALGAMAVLLWLLPGSR